MSTAIDAETELEQVHAEYLATKAAAKASLDQHNDRVDRIYRLPIIGQALYILNMFTGDPIEEFRPWVKKYHRLVQQEGALLGLSEHYAGQVPGTYAFRNLAITAFGRNFEIEFDYDRPEKGIHLSPTIISARFVKEWSLGKEIPTVSIQKGLPPTLYLPMETKGIPLTEMVVGMGSYDRFTRHPVWTPNLGMRVEMISPDSIRPQLYYPLRFAATS